MGSPDGRRTREHGGQSHADPQSSRSRQARIRVLGAAWPPARFARGGLVSGGEAAVGAQPGRTPSGNGRVDFRTRDGTVARSEPRELRVPGSVVPGDANPLTTGPVPDDVH